MTPTEISKELSLIREFAGHAPNKAKELLLAVAPYLVRSEHILAGNEIISILLDHDRSMTRRRLAVLGDVTVNGVAAAATIQLFSERILAETYIAPFGTLRQEILDPNSNFYKFKPDIVIIFPTPHIPIPTVPGELKNAQKTISDIIVFWQNSWNIIAERLPNVRIIHHLYELPGVEICGIAEQRVLWSPIRMTTEINQGLVSAAPPFVHLLDMEQLAARVGKYSWRDPRLWYHGKVPFALKHMNEYVLALGGALRRAIGKSRKALIVDLDNTLWGGVIGDDGYDGIRIGPGDPVGEAYADFCTYIKTLGTRGVIIGICSKNNPDIALKVFEINPHMPLKLEDFSVIRCNWDDKATNLRGIASELNIDLSAIVFADDNPAECELIRRELPTVSVVNLDGDPASFIRQIDAKCLFESDVFSHEDLTRTASYHARKMADDAKTSATNLDEYLNGLDMVGSIWLARKEDIPRLAQMEMKTNQFNVTTKRWSADQLRQFLESVNHDVICFSLTDKYADHGLVSSMVIEYKGNIAHILSWLMSCRVLSRTAEAFIMNDIIERAKKRHMAIITGEYLPTEKNGIVAGLYPQLGFVPDPKSELFFHYDLQTSLSIHTHIKKEDFAK